MLKSVAATDVPLYASKVLHDVPFGVIVLFAVLALGLVYNACFAEKSFPGVPEVRIERKGYERFFPAYLFWLKDGKGLVSNGLRQFQSCFQISTGSGFKIVVPNRFADELKSHPDLNFNEAFAKDLFVHYPGFDGIRQGLKDDTFMQEVVRVKLTQSLGLITDDLVEETTDSLHDVLGDDEEWQSRLVKEDVLEIVARLSSRVFLGKDLCRNRDWLDITKNYTVDSFMAANLLRLCPGIVRPLLYWFIPTCTRLRQEVKHARKLILPEVEKRRRQAEATIKDGQKVKKTADAVGWMVEIARDRQIDYVAAQLSLSLAAIHTTSETTASCILQLCETPEIVPMLREEVIRVLSENGWSKVSLYKLKLLDSFLKEVQRLRGMSSASMNRFVKKAITLSDGTVLPVGSRIMVLDEKQHDATSFPEPAKFDVARFKTLREREGEENRHQFVTATSSHMGFGYGQHACPGRFFASNEIKILLCLVLLQYDFRYIPDGAKPTYREFALSRSVDPQTRVQMRRRHEEIDLLDPSSDSQESE